MSEHDLPEDEPELGHSIDVRCSDSSHEGRVAKVGSYWAPHGSGGGFWLRHPMFLSDPEDGPLNVYKDGTVRGPRAEHGHARREALRYGVHAPESPDHVRENLLCKLCGLKVSVRDSTLGPILDRLHEADITSIELSHLARIVSEHQQSRSG